MLIKSNEQWEAQHAVPQTLGSGEQSQQNSNGGRGNTGSIGYNSSAGTKPANLKAVEARIRQVVAQCEFKDARGGAISNKSIEVRVFGSCCNGFGTAASDLDVTLLTPDGLSVSPAAILREVAAVATDTFQNVTRILTAQVPVLKLTDPVSKMEVDLCVNNRLGLRNTELLQTYVSLDPRAAQLGKIIKTWAKRKEIVGTTDGYLNSYAYMLMVIFFLQKRGILPNLQELGKKFGDTPVWVGGESTGENWDTTFHTRYQGHSRNGARIYDLTLDFFRFYKDFDWKTRAVSVKSGPQDCDKSGLFERNPLIKTVPEQCAGDRIKITGPPTEHWWIQDPFDLYHNLAGKCTLRGKKHIYNCILETITDMGRRGRGLPWMNTWMNGDPSEDEYKTTYLRFRISDHLPSQSSLVAHNSNGSGAPANLVKYPGTNTTGVVTGQQILGRFLRYQVQHVYVIEQPERKTKDVFLSFIGASDRRRAHAENESFIGDWQLQMSRTSHAAYLDAISQSNRNYQVFTNPLPTCAAAKSSPGGGRDSTTAASSSPSTTSVGSSRSGSLLSVEGLKANAQPFVPAWKAFNPAAAAFVPSPALVPNSTPEKQGTTITSPSGKRQEDWGSGKTEASSLGSLQCSSYADSPLFHFKEKEKLDAAGAGVRLPAVPPVPATNLPDHVKTLETRIEMLTQLLREKEVAMSQLLVKNHALEAEVAELKKRDRWGKEPGNGASVGSGAASNATSAPGGVSANRVSRDGIRSAVNGSGSASTDRGSGVSSAPPGLSLPTQTGGAGTTTGAANGTSTTGASSTSTEGAFQPPPPPRAAAPDKRPMPLPPPIPSLYSLFDTATSHQQQQAAAASAAMAASAHQSQHQSRLLANMMHQYHGQGDSMQHHNTAMMKLYSQHLSAAAAAGGGAAPIAQMMYY
ncbi:unnamed protein product [Amoebophrya sp. A25]|nr:unnamed protein product [Amoebophrya sp. A25]|eukprot:GSA25T00012134001.1